MNYCLKVIYMNHLLFTFKNINDKVRIMDKNHRKVKVVHLRNDCIVATDSIRVQKLEANGCFDNVLKLCNLIF